jgi:hypothetical protein
VVIVTIVKLALNQIIGYSEKIIKMTKNYSLKNLMALNKKYLMTESEVVDNH